MEAEPNSELTRIVVGGVPEHFNFPWHQAIDKNAFVAQGVELEFVEFQDGTGAMTQALREREIDMALLLTEGCVADLLKGNPSRMVKVFVESPLIWGIHVAAGSQIHAIEQIEGCRYAISRLGSGSHLMAIVDASLRGWSTQDIEFVKVNDLAGAREALAASEADIFFWEKYTTNPYVISGEFRRIGVRETPWPAFVVCVHDDCLAMYQQTVRLILNVVNTACDNLMRNDRAGELISQRYGIQLGVVEEWIGLTKWGMSFENPENQIQMVRDYLEKLDLVPVSNRPTTDLWLKI